MRDLTENEILELLAKYPLPEGVEDCVMNREELAEAMATSLPTVSDWIGKGMPVITVGGAGKSYELQLSHCWAWRLNRNAEDDHRTEQVRRAQAALRLALVGGKSGDSLEALDPKQRREIIEVQMVHEQFKRSRNELIERADAHELLETVFALIRDGLNFAPDKIEAKHGLPSKAVDALVDACDEVQDNVRRKIAEFWDARPVKDDKTERRSLFDA